MSQEMKMCDKCEDYFTKDIVRLSMTRPDGSEVQGYELCGKCSQKVCDYIGGFIQIGGKHDVGEKV